MWVAKNSTEDVVGFAMADIVDDQGYLVEVDVSPEYFRRGIGTSLVGAVLDWGRREQFDYLALVTFGHLPWNAAFYEKLGFSIIDAAEREPGIEGLIQEEGKLGINIANRVTMRVVF